MSKWKYLILGVFIGGIIVASGIFVSSFLRYRLVAPPGTWVERAQKSTLTGKRFFTLPLNNPSVVQRNHADHMAPRDPVVGIVVNGQARAYPWWILCNYHVANDTIHGTPVYVALCELCSGACAFYPVIKELPERPLSFQVSGIGHGVYLVSDFQTLSRWHPLSGIAIEGSLKGKKLRKISTIVTSWKEWKKIQPDTDVAYASAELRHREHGRGTNKIGHPNKFYKAITRTDDRLPSNELVFGLVGNDSESGLAIPLRKVKEKPFLEISFQKQPILLLIWGDSEVNAFIRKHGNEVLKIESCNKEFMCRDHTGTVWNRWGKAVSGPHKGASLQPARGYMTEWYEWSDGFPKTTIYSSD